MEDLKMENTETCVLCGAEIPEGIRVCPSCERKGMGSQGHFINRYATYIARGDVFFADLNPVVGSETGGIRPVVILQNDIGNRHSATVIVAITSRAHKKDLPVHVLLTEKNGGLTDGTTILLEQIRTIDKRRLCSYLGHLNEEIMKRIDTAAICSIGLANNDNG